MQIGINLLNESTHQHVDAIIAGMIKKYGIVTILIICLMIGILGILLSWKDPLHFIFNLSACSTLIGLLGLFVRQAILWFNQSIYKKI